MTITVPLTAEEEAKLAAIAAGRGVSPGAIIEDVVRGVLARTQSSIEELSPNERERRLDDLFAAFDSVTTPDDIREEAFHREH